MRCAVAGAAAADTTAVPMLVCFPQKLMFRQVDHDFTTPWPRAPPHGCASPPPPHAPAPTFRFQSHVSLSFFGDVSDNRPDSPWGVVGAAQMPGRRFNSVYEARVQQLDLSAPLFLRRVPPPLRRVPSRSRVLQRASRRSRHMSDSRASRGAGGSSEAAAFGQDRTGVRTQTFPQPQSRHRHAVVSDQDRGRRSRMPDHARRHTPTPCSECTP